MFADPQTITFNSVAQTLVRTGSGIDTGVFKEVGGEFTLSFSHAYGKRTRRTARLDYRVLAADVMDSSLNVPYSASIYIVVDVPNVGISQNNINYLGNAFLAYLSASGDARFQQLTGGES